MLEVDEGVLGFFAARELDESEPAVVRRVQLLRHSDLLHLPIGLEQLLELLSGGLEGKILDDKLRRSVCILISNSELSLRLALLEYGRGAFDVLPG